MRRKEKLLVLRPEDWILVEQARRRKRKLTMIRHNQRLKRNRFLWRLPIEQQEVRNEALPSDRASQPNDQSSLHR